MAGIDRHTGRVIDNFTSALQGVEVTLSTRIGSRVMRRPFGGGVVELLGRAITDHLFAAFLQLVGTAIDIYEPRFHIRWTIPQGSAEEIRLGHLGILLVANFRPRAHLDPPDFTVERVVNLTLSFRAGKPQVVA